MAIAEAAFGGGVFVFGKETGADENLHTVEGLAGEGHHAVHEAGLDEGTAEGIGVLGAEVVRCYIKAKRRVVVTLS